MRTLSSTLLSAQRAASRVPYVKVTATNKLTDVIHLKWDRLYTGTEDDCYHAVTIPGDGSLIRVRITPGSDSCKLYRQRVASPGPQSDFSTWTYTNEYNCQAVAVAACGSEVSIFWVNLNRELRRIKSTDYGATWGSAQTLDYSPGTSVYGVAAAYKPNGDIAVFFTSENTLYVKQCVSGNWQEKSAWDKTAGELSSVAVVYDGDWNLLVTGQDTSGNYKVWSLVYGDGGAVPAGTWSELKEFASAPSGGDFEYRSISLDKPDVYRAFYAEKFNGTQAYNRPYWSHTIAGTSFISGLWREPVPFNLSSEYGMAMTHHGNYCWLSTPDGVWRASLAEATLELTADVIGIRLESSPINGGLMVELRNDTGKYNSPGAGGLSILDTGCQLDFSPGYVTSQGNEVSPGLAFWLDAYEHTSSGGKASLVLHNIDGWRLLADWRARHQFRWNKDSDQMSAKQIMEFVLARVGLSLEVKSQSSVITSYYPDFTIHPDDSGTAIVTRLLSFVPDVVFMEGIRVFLANPLGSDSSAYSYGQSHAILQGRYRTGTWETNQVRVEGYDSVNSTPIIADSFSWGQIDKFCERLRPVTDRNIGTLSEAEDRGETLLRKSEVRSVSGTIQVPVSCGQQLYDVIDITDSRAALSAAKRRVLGIVLSYRPERGEYFQQLILGGV